MTSALHCDNLKTEVELIRREKLVNSIALEKKRSSLDNKEEGVDIKVVNQDWEVAEEEVTVILKITTKLRDQVTEISQELTINLNTLEIRTLTEEIDLMPTIGKQEITEPQASKTVLWEEIEAVLVAHVVLLVLEVMVITEVVDVVDMTPVDKTSEIIVRLKKDCKSHL